MANDKPKEGEGCLVLGITEEQGAEISGVRIYLSQIRITGEEGGIPQVRLAFIGPKDVAIKRVKNGKTVEPKQKPRYSFDGTTKKEEWNND